MLLRHLSVGTRLAIGFTTLLVIASIITAVGLSNLAALNAKLDTLAHATFDRMSTLNKMRDTVRFQAISLRDVVMQEDLAFKKTELKLMKAAREEYLALSQRLLKSLEDTEYKKATAAISELEERIKALAQEAINLSLEDEHQAAGDAVRERVRPAQLELISAFDQLIKRLEQQAQGDAERAHTDFVHAVQIMVAMGAFAILLGIILAVSLTRSIARPLRVAVDLADRVAAGDLTSRLSVTGSDELARLMHALNRMSVSLSSTIQEVQKAGDSASDLASRVARSTGQLTGHAQVQADRTAAVSATMEELSVSVAEVLLGANGVLDAADRSKSMVSTAEDTARQASETAVRVLNEVESSSASVESLNKAIQRIAEITQVIDGIAEQTNLLALNAAIESARAGENGRGFGVVADEVRQLSNRTAVSITDIAKIIAEVKKCAQGSVTAMASVKMQVSEGTRHSEVTTGTFREIDECASRVTDLAKNIVIGTREQTAATEEAARNIEKVSTLAEDVANSLREVDQLAGELHNTATGLRQIASKFTVQAQ